MIPTFNYLINKYNIKIKGVIHVGAHEGQETLSYINENISKVILIEANPYRFENLKESIQTGRYCTNCTPLEYIFLNQEQADILKKYTVYNYAISDVEEGFLEFNLSNYDGGVDSLFKINNFGTSSSWVNYEHVDKIKVPTITLDNLIKDKNEFNFLNIDVEGAELLVLKGSVELLKNIDFILLETQDIRRFDGSCTKQDLIDYLKNFNFKLVEYFDTGKNWGDSFFIKNKYNVIF